MAETRRKFDQDFRDGAVRLVRETGKPIAQVARDLGINDGTHQRAQFGIAYAVSCRALGVSQAWLYKWLHGDVSLRQARRAAVDAAVAYEFARRQGRDGSPPIT